MVTSRISTYSYHQRLLSDYTGVQANLADMQRQISSGKLAQNFEELNGKVERVNALESKLKVMNQNMESNSQIASQLQTMGDATEQIIEITDDAIKLLTTAQSATQTQYPIFAQQLKNMLTSVAGLLNSNSSGRYLFAGGKTDTRPVIEPVPDNYATGVPDESYYQGDNEVMTARISEGFLLEYGVNANEEGFQNLIASFNAAINALGSNNQNLLKTSFSLMVSSADDINGIKARINANMVAVEDANKFINTTKSYILGIYGEETSADLPSLSTEVALQQAVLQASFQAFAKISALNLADFLR